MGLYDKSNDPPNAVTEKDVKLCALCGALNYNRNSECYTCGWRGVFDRNEAMIHLAWVRLYDQFECVEMEHVTGKRSFLLGEFGHDGPVKYQAKNRWTEWITNIWRGFLARRDARAASREMKTHQFPQNGLGV